MGVGWRTHTRRAEGHCGEGYPGRSWHVQHTRWQARISLEGLEQNGSYISALNCVATCIKGQDQSDLDKLRLLVAFVVIKWRSEAC